MDTYEHIRTMIDGLENRHLNSYQNDESFSKENLEKLVKDFKAEDFPKLYEQLNDYVADWKNSDELPANSNDVEKLMETARIEQTFASLPTHMADFYDNEVLASSRGTNSIPEQINYRKKPVDYTINLLKEIQQERFE